MATSRNSKEIFSEREQNIFLNIIATKKEIVESKQNEAKTLQARLAAWDSISRQYNSDSGIRVFRTVQELKDLYKRLKVDAKKQYTNYGKALHDTGGGPRPNSPDALSKSVFQLIPQDFVPGDNPCDDDYDSSIASSPISLSQERAERVSCRLDKETELPVPDYVNEPGPSSPASPSLISSGNSDSIKVPFNVEKFNSTASSSTALKKVSDDNNIHVYAPKPNQTLLKRSHRSRLSMS